MINDVTRLPRFAAQEPDDPLASLMAPPLGPGLLRALVDQLPVGVLVADATGRVIHENQIAQDLRTSHATLLDGPISRALLLGEVVREEEVELVSNRMRRWVTVCATPIRGTLGGVDAAVVTLVDRTALKQLAAWAPAIRSLQSL